MKTLLAAVALVALASAATPAFADPSSNCAVQQPDTPALPQIPADSCSQCALPTPPVQKLADCTTAGCAVEQPDTPAIPPTPEDASGCSGCALPTLPVLKLADGTGCTNCAVEQPDTPAVPQTPEEGNRLRRLRLADAARAEAGGRRYRLQWLRH
jgi:hypothetical protein